MSATHKATTIKIRWDHSRYFAGISTLTVGLYYDKLIDLLKQIDPTINSLIARVRGT